MLNRSRWREDELVVPVENHAEAPLDRLAAAAALARELNQLSDDVVGYFVAAAREAGHPWSQIGGALGTSKQAAQQRFADPDLSRYTDRARLAVANAAQTARRLDHRWVAGEHLLLGLAEVTDSVAAKALMAFGGISAEQLRAAIAELRGAPAQVPPAGEAPITAAVATLLGRLAPAEATALGHNYVGTEHILLAILRWSEGTSATILQTLSVDVDGLRETVLQLMSNLDPADRPA